MAKNQLLLLANVNKGEEIYENVTMTYETYKVGCASITLVTSGVLNAYKNKYIISPRVSKWEIWDI